MLIYNVTTKVSWDIHEAWVEWMKTVHIPQVMETGCFTNARFARLLETDEEDGPTYTAQYDAKDEATYRRYTDRFAPALRQDMFDQWGNKFISFRSLMEVVN